MKRLRVLLDMDEVLVDFVGGACREFGLLRESVEAEWEPGRWDMVPPLGRALGLPEGQFTAADFWRPLSRNEPFWLGLASLPWATNLVSLVQSLTDDWHIVTSPSRCPTSYSGKVKWLKTRFSDAFDRFAITPHKEIFAGPNVILIDDRHETIDRFVAAGGEGIVFPTLHNREHARRADPMAYVREQLSPPRF